MQAKSIKPYDYKHFKRNRQKLQVYNFKAAYQIFGNCYGLKLPKNADFSLNKFVVLFIIIQYYIQIA